MNLLLSNFSDDNSKELSELLINYQEYFNFEKNNNDTSLYLDIKNLKKYLIEGKEIKYRKFIFLFLENLVNQKKVRNYNLNYDKIQIKVNNIIYKDILNNVDISNINKTLSIINYLNKNNIKINNNNIYKLDNNLYADIKNKRFVNNKFINNYKYNIKINGFIINNTSYLKNLIIILNCLSNYKNTRKIENKLNNILINTKCNLIITSKIKSELIISKLLSMYENIKYYEIHNINNLINLKYKDVNNYDYIFFNINFVNNYLKYFDNDYNNNINSNIYEIIENLIIEQNINENLVNCELKNIFMYKWNNLIIDNFNKINKNDIQYLKNITVNNYNFINYELLIDDYMLKNMSYFLLDNCYLNDYGYYNFRSIIKNELILKNNGEIQKENYEIINIQDNDESNIINKLNNNKNHEIELAKLFIKSSNKFLHKDTIKNIKNLIDNKNNFNNIIENDCTSCCICIDKIENSNLCILKCGHHFCKSCILTHKINQELNNYESKCPICRYNYNLIYNITENKVKFNFVIDNLNNILKKEINKKVLITADHNEILTYIKEMLNDNYDIDIYKKKNNVKNQINLISINYLKKNIVNDVDIIIFFTFSAKAYQKYIEIKNIYSDYYLDKIKFYLFNYNKN